MGDILWHIMREIKWKKVKKKKEREEFVTRAEILRHLSWNQFATLFRRCSSSQPKNPIQARNRSVFIWKVLVEGNHTLGAETDPGANWRCLCCAGRETDGDGDGAKPMSNGAGIPRMSDRRCYQCDEIECRGTLVSRFGNYQNIISYRPI